MVGNESSPFAPMRAPRLGFWLCLALQLSARLRGFEERLSRVWTRQFRLHGVGFNLSGGSLPALGKLYRLRTDKLVIWCGEFPARSLGRVLISQTVLGKFTRECFVFPSCVKVPRGPEECEQLDSSASFGRVPALQVRGC